MSYNFLNHSDAGTEPVNLAISNMRKLSALLDFHLYDEQHWTGKNAQFLHDNIETALVNLPEASAKCGLTFEYLEETLPRIRRLVDYAITTNTVVGYY